MDGRNSWIGTHIVWSFAILEISVPEKKKENQVEYWFSNKFPWRLQVTTANQHVYHYQKVSS